MLRLLVLKTKKLLALKGFYELLGLHFQEEKHGKGPLHFSTTINDKLVFELYPLTKDVELDLTIRLGFEVSNVESTIAKIKFIEGKIVSLPKDTAWGKRAVIKDLDGRTVELYESEKQK